MHWRLALWDPDESYGLPNDRTSGGAAPGRRLRARRSEGVAEPTRRAARELLEHGTYERMEPAVPFGEANGMFAGSGS
jgi:hypothetical protein